MVYIISIALLTVIFFFIILPSILIGIFAIEEIVLEKRRDKKAERLRLVQKIMNS